jgi:hypothetical protein
VIIPRTSINLDRHSRFSKFSGLTPDQRLIVETSTISACPAAATCIGAEVAGSGTRAADQFFFDGEAPKSLKSLSDRVIGQSFPFKTGNAQRLIA